MDEVIQIKSNITSLNFVSWFKQTKDKFQNWRVVHFNDQIRNSYTDTVTTQVFSPTSLYAGTIKYPWLYVEFLGANSNS